MAKLPSLSSPSLQNVNKHREQRLGTLSLTMCVNVPWATDINAFDITTWDICRYRPP